MSKAKQKGTVFQLNYFYHYYDYDGEIETWAIYDSKDTLLADLDESFLKNRYSKEEIQIIRESLDKTTEYDDTADVRIWIEQRGLYTSSEWTKEDSWAELKETIEELKDNGGEGSQKDICGFLFNLMNILEKQEGQRK